MRTQASSTLSRSMRFSAHFMAAWVLLIWPLQWLQAYAQALPETFDSQLINSRSQKLGSGWSDSDDPVRLPNLEGDSTPVRTPNLDTGSADSNLANKAAEKYQPLQVGDIVQGAQRGSNFAQGLYGGADPSNYHLETNRAEVGQTQTTTGRVNLNEIMPVYNSNDLNEMQSLGSTIYSNPSQAKTLAEQNARKLKRIGCRRTEFKKLNTQNIYNAPYSVNHRILKIEFYDIEEVAIPNTDPVEYQTVLTPSFFRRGQLDLSRATLGGVSAQWWDRVDETFAIRYTYTPYTNPKDQNFFTYNHKLGYFQHGPYVVVPDNHFASYGRPRDGFTPVISHTIPYGVGEIYISADLYRTEVSYFDPPEGQICQPDPPAVCEVGVVGGGTIRWCPGSPGAGVFEMYDDHNQPSAQQLGKDYSDMTLGNATSRNYSNDGALQGGVLRGLNAGSSSLAQELAGNCSRETISTIETGFDLSYPNEDVYLCSETLINPYPNGCHTIKRSFGLSRLGDQNYLTVRAFNKIAEPVIDPSTGQQVVDEEFDEEGNLISSRPVYTYRHEPAYVNGAIDTDFSVLGASRCHAGNGAGCSTEPLPDDRYGSSTGYYLEYDHTPLVGDSMSYAVGGIFVEGGSGSFSHYGRPEQNWKPTGSASGNGTRHELRLNAEVYAVTINTFAGCEKYLEYVADGFCRNWGVTCIDETATRTVGGLTFGAGLATEGVLDLLKKWGTTSSAVFPDYDDGTGIGPRPIGPEITLLDNPMCWEAIGEPFESCSTMLDTGGLEVFDRNGEIWATDCHITLGPDGNPVSQSPACRPADRYADCDDRFIGLYSGICYNPTTAYDCGEETSKEVPLTYTEEGNVCSGVMRCLGTECHRPNLTGMNSEDFAQAAAGMEALNMMKMDMTCAETGRAPTSTSQTCTPQVFGGEAMYCKIPIGNEIGLTPNCCEETKDAVADSGPNWMDYLKATYLLYKIGENDIVQNLLGTSDLYNSTSKLLGEVAQPVTDAYKTASNFVTEKFVQPLTSGFDNLFANFGAGGSGGTAATVGVDTAAKQGIIGQVTQSLTQTLLKNAHNILVEIGGEELASQIITVSGSGLYQLTPLAANIVSAINLAFMIYSLARLIGHIIFACKEEEYEWAMNMKWRLCTYAGSCCNKKVFIIGCVEKRQLYCCYKSIAARVIADQIIKKGLIASRANGYRSGSNGSTLKNCNINCTGFTPAELAQVDWAQVDLSEWLDSLIESGLFNPSNPGTNYGVVSNMSVEVTQAVGRTEDTEGLFDQNVSAAKTLSGWGPNVSVLQENTSLLRQAEHCYTDDRQMPFTYPECDGTSEEPTF